MVGYRNIVILVLLIASLVLATLPASAEGLNSIAYDALDDVIDLNTEVAVDQPGIDILNVRILDLNGDLEISMGVNASVLDDASYTVNIMVDDTDLFTFSKTSGGFTVSDPIGSPVAVSGWIEPGRVDWEVATSSLSIDTKVEISTAYTYFTEPTGAVHTDSLDDQVTTNDPPTAAITWPTEDLEVSGYINVTGTASDDTAVLGVLVRIDGGDWDLAEGKDTWTYEVNTTNLSDGSHLIEVRSYDVELQSAIVNVTIVVDNGATQNDPPTVDITWPDGNTVSGTIDITGTASDDTSVMGVLVRMDGGDWITAIGTTDWTFQVDTATLSDGEHTFEVVAFDEGEVSSPIVTGTLWADQDPPTDNDPPSAYIRRPLNADTLTGTVKINGTATDDTVVTMVSIRVDDGNWEVATGTDNWYFDLDTTPIADGVHTFSVKAYDGQLESAITTYVYVVDNVPGSIYPMTTVITFPTDGQAVTGTINFTGTAFPEDSIQGIYIHIDSGDWMLLIKQYHQWSYTMDTTVLTDGLHTLEAYAAGVGGAVSDIAVTSFWVGDDPPPDNLPPYVTFTNLRFGFTIVRTLENFTFEGTVYDDRGVVGVEIRLNGGDWSVASLSGDTWSLGFNLRPLVPATWQIVEVRAFDGTQYSTIAANDFEMGYNEEPYINLTVLEKKKRYLVIEGRSKDEADPILKVEFSLDTDYWIELPFQLVNGSPLNIVWTYNQSFDALVIGDHSLEFRTFDGYYWSDVEIHDFDVAKLEGGVNPKASGPGPLLVLLAMVVVMIIMRGIRKDRRE